LTDPLVLVTGADGFIGSHLVERLLSRGYRVRAFCMYNSFGSNGWLDSIPLISDQIEIKRGDIRDPLCVANAMKGCSIVFHLAALIGIPYSYVAPRSYLETNTIGTLNVLQSAKDLSNIKVIHTSTSEVYGTAKYVPIDENHPIIGQSPYSASKIGADQLAISFYKSFQTPLCILRPFNTYGPRQSQRAIIPTVINQFLSGNFNLRLGLTTPTRDFNFVTDTCDAFIAVSESDLCNGRILNSASSFEVSIAQTIDYIADVMNISDYSITQDPDRLRPTSSEVERLYGDASLLKSLTNWSPSYGGIDGFKNGLSVTAEWFQHYFKSVQSTSTQFLL
tara:strand:- start:4614 stop:5618 length:1005 start_codon:yes stop_codon:yes gene_type:complete